MKSILNESKPIYSIGIVTVEDLIKVPNIMSDQVAFPKPRSMFSIYEPG